MSKRIYLSERSRWWPIERQEQVLADVLPGAKVFRDWNAAARPTSHDTSGEVIHIASLAVLPAERETQLKAVLASVEARGAKLVSATDAEISPAAWLHARRHSRLRGASTLGAETSAALRRAHSDEAVERIRARWGDPAYKVADLLLEAGVSRGTVNARLGGREEAMRRFLASQKRKATKAKKAQEAQSK